MRRSARRTLTRSHSLQVRWRASCRRARPKATSRRSRARSSPATPSRSAPPGAPAAPVPSPRLATPRPGVAPSTVAGPERCCCYTRYSDAQRDVAFSIATAGGFEVPMRALESQGADPNARTEGGDTAVMWAAQGCQLQSLTILHELLTSTRRTISAGTRSSGPAPTRRAWSRPLESLRTSGWTSRRRGDPPRRERPRARGALAADAYVARHVARPRRLRARHTSARRRPRGRHQRRQRARPHRAHGARRSSSAPAPTPAPAPRPPPSPRPSSPG